MVQVVLEGHLATAKMSESQEELQWLYQTNTPGFRRQNRKPNCWTCLNGKIPTGKSQPIRQEPRICVECGYHHLGTDRQSQARKQTEALHRIHETTMRIADNNSDIGTDAHPMLFGLLVHHATDALANELCRLAVIPELEYTKRFVADKIQNVSTIYPYKYEAALVEAEMLGAKVLVTRTLGEIEGKPRSAGLTAHDMGKHLLGMWLETIHTSDDIKAASDIVRSTKAYKNFSCGGWSTETSLDTWLGHWEQTLTDALKFRKNKMFYATRVYGNMTQYASDTAYHTRPQTALAVLYSGLKMHRNNNGIGELPELVVEWIRSETRDMETAFSGPTHDQKIEHQNLNPEQWQTVFDLWSEAEPRTVYYALKEAIEAGTKL